MSRIVAKVYNLDSRRPIPKEGKQSKNYLFIGFVPSYELKNFDKYKGYLSAIYTETNDKGEKKVAEGTNEPDIRHYRLSGEYNKDRIDINEDTYNIYTMDETSDYTNLNSWRIFGDKFFDVIFLDRSVKGYISSLNLSDAVYPFQDYDHANQIYNQIYKKLKKTGKFYHETHHPLEKKIDKKSVEERQRGIENTLRKKRGIQSLQPNELPLTYYSRPDNNPIFQGFFRYEKTVEDPILQFRNPVHARGQSRGFFKEYSKNVNPSRSVFERLKSSNKY